MSARPPAPAGLYAGRLELFLIEGRVFMEIFELVAVLGIVNDGLLRPRTGFNFGRKHHALSPG